MICRKENGNKLLDYIRKGKGKLFLKLISPYICVLATLLLLWIVSNAYVSRSIEKKQVSIIKNNIETNVYATEVLFGQLEDIIFSISQNEAYDYFFKEKKLTYAKKKRYADMLSDCLLGKEMLEEIFVYSKASDLIINHQGIFDSPEEFFEFQYTIADCSAEEWAEGLRNGNLANGYSCHTIKGDLLKRGFDALSYIRMTPLESLAKKTGVIGAVIDKEKLLKGFASMLSNGNGEIYLFNGDTLVASQGQKYIDYALEKDVNRKGYTELKESGEKLYKFVCVDSKNNWRYVVFLDSDYVVSDIASVNTILNVINVLSLFIGLAICVYFAYKRSKSNTEILRMLGAENEFSINGMGLNEFDFWKPYLENVIKEKEQMKEKMQNIFESGEHKILHLLLAKMQKSEEDAENIVKNSELKFGCKKFSVMVLRNPSTYNIDAITNKNMFFKYVLEKYIDTDFYVYIADFKTTVIILNYDMDKEDMCMLLKEQIVKMNLEVFYRYQPNIIIGLGEETMKLSEIYNSYVQALETVRYGELMGLKSILMYNELPHEPTMYDFSVDFENRFINTILSGKTEDALKMVDEIYNNNFVKLTLSVKRTEELFGEILSSLNKAKRVCLKYDELIECGIGDFTIRNFFDYVKDFIFSLCKEIEFMNENISIHQINEIEKYIDENYHDSALSLTSLASHFGFKRTSYMSKVFKNIMGENFYSYLEKKRIEKASELLIEGVKISEVSEKVGYLSDVSFRRAFKKCTGFSPTDYIVNIQDEKQKL